MHEYEIQSRYFAANGMGFHKAFARHTQTHTHTANERVEDHRNVNTGDNKWSHA